MKSKLKKQRKLWKAGKKNDKGNFNERTRKLKEEEKKGKARKSKNMIVNMQGKS